MDTGHQVGILYGAQVYQCILVPFVVSVPIGKLSIFRHKVQVRLRGVSYIIYFFLILPMSSQLWQRDRVYGRWTGTPSAMPLCARYGRSVIPFSTKFFLLWEEEP